jgi:hypothetical protein
MSLEKIKQLTNTVLVNFFHIILKHDDNLKKWHNREITADTLTSIMSEIKQESMLLQKLKQPNMSLVSSVVLLDQPYRVHQDITDATSIDECVQTLISYHRSFAQAHPTPTRLYQNQQIMEKLVKGVLNDVVTQNLVSDEWKEKITTHLATQKIAATRSDAYYRFGFIKDKSAQESTINTVEPAATNRIL